MLFNSLCFLIFLPLAFCFYWFVFGRNIRMQNLFVIFISYIFYGWWDWRFLFLIAFTSGCSFLAGMMIEHYRKQGDTKTARNISIGNVVVNLSILGVFKYYNFFIGNLESLLSAFNCHLDYPTLNIILPVGISFYTFQALSYTIDVYRNKIEATKDPCAFFAFISFFPQLVAGPIERATNLLPQFQKDRTFDYAAAVDGCRQMLLGFCKKILIADMCAVEVDAIWANYQNESSVGLLVGALLFSFQIYGDFSGYSDIAIGTAKLFGIRLMANFKHPYLSRDVAEFWKRWHISLNTWFVDYVYIPLGGSRNGNVMKFRNTLVIFLLSGLWHGARWTFVFWGLYHALLFLPLMLLGSNHRYKDVVAMGRKLPNVREVLQIATTFFLVMIGWIFFRAESLSRGLGYLMGMFNVREWSSDYLSKPILAYCVVLMLVEWLQRDKEHAFQFPDKGIFKYYFFRYVLYVTIISILLSCSGEPAAFIYFQF